MNASISVVKWLMIVVTFKITLWSCGYIFRALCSLTKHWEYSQSVA